ncbi:MAG: prepilin-type N-terminal cleavage/methylation domain-containing protein [Planctomycetota bacterium]
MSGVRPHSTARRGVTLLELLVVIGIMLVLLAVAIPAMQFLPEGRRVREASRSVTVFFGAARNKAITTGRPVGVLLERLDRQPQACAVLREAEVPFAYGGDVEGAMVFPGMMGGYVRLRVKPNELSPGLIRRGDLIQLNYQGPFYTIVDDTTDNNPAGDPSPPADPGQDFPLRDVFIDFDPPGFTVNANGWINNRWLTLAVDPKGGYNVPWGSGSSAVPFKIYRLPVASSGRVLQLSRGAVIDLGASGTDRMPGTFDPENATDLRPVVVMFSPNGGVDQVYFFDSATGSYGRDRAASPIHFMVGKWERMALQPGGPAQAEDGLWNWQDATNLWVTLNPQTGLVTVAEVSTYYVDPADDQLKDNVDLLTNTSLALTVYDSRRLAREAQVSKGGR